MWLGPLASPPLHVAEAKTWEWVRRDALEDGRTVPIGKDGPAGLSVLEYFLDLTTQVFLRQTPREITQQRPLDQREQGLKSPFVFLSRQKSYFGHMWSHAR